MAKYIIKRVLSALPTLFVVVTLVFMLMRILPGNPVHSLMDTSEMTAEEIEEVSERMGFNDPLIVQYGRYLKGILSGDWGVSYFNGRDVMENIIESDDLVILGNRYEVQLCAIELNASCIIACLLLNFKSDMVTKMT